jgi:uncharacterized protein (TIGR04255 family)
MAKLGDREIYPNSPLVDVTCEIRFPGELQVECSRDLFWNKIRKDYPTILVPHSKDGQAAALQHYRFRSKDQSRVVSVAINSLAFSESKYSGHVKFIAEFKRLAAIFKRCFPKIDKVSRFGWRYVNIMPYQRENGHVPVRRLTKVEFKLPTDVSERLTGLDSRFEFDDADGAVAIVRMATVVPQRGSEALPGEVTREPQPNQQEALLVDLDFVRTGDNLRFGQFATQITKLRRRNRELFEALITDEYREYLRGDAE